MGKGVYIPESILSLTDLGLIQKAILALVIAYGQCGCFQSNRKLAEFFGCSVTTVKTAIKALKNGGYIRDIEASKLKRCLKANRSKCTLFIQDKIGRNAPQDRVESDPQQGEKSLINRVESDPQIKEGIKPKDNLKKTFGQNSDEFRLTTILFNQIRLRKPDYKKPNLQAWAEHIDYMIRLDHRKVEHIEAVINWCQQDDFWQNNILGTEKLRKHFDRLELQMGEKKYGGTTTHQRDFKKQQSSIGTVVAV